MKTISLVNVLNKFDRGWTDVNLLSGKKVSLPYGTSFGFIQDNLLIILDGHHRGDSIKLAEGCHLIQLLGYKQLLTHQPITIKYDSKNNKLIFQGDRVYTLIRPMRKILSVGKYRLELPRFPHKRLCKSVYLDESIGGSRFAETWFEIVPVYGKRVSSFLHYGEISDGCLTVSMKGNQKNIWTDIYLALIVNRLHSTFVADLIAN